MKAKRYLGEYHILRRRCETLEQNLERLTAQIQGVKGITYDKDRVQTSITNATEDQIIRLADKRTEYINTIEECHAKLLELDRKISKLRKPEHIEILRLRYLEVTPHGQQYTLEQIAVETHWSYDRVRHLHGEALAAFGRKYLGQ